MAGIIGAIASSHTPAIGLALDRNKRDDPVWAPIFAAYEPIRRWLAQRQPDAPVVTYNDHVTSFFFDHHCAFALGIAGTYPVADEGGGLARSRPSPATPRCRTTSASAWWPTSSICPSSKTARSTTGCSRRCRCRCCGTSPDGRCRSCRCRSACSSSRCRARRCYKLGQALRRAIESYPEDPKVVIVATGGLSHQVHGERAGFNNTPWDMHFLELVEKDPERLAEMTQAEYATLGGMEGAEVIMWLVMRAVMSATIRKLHQTYYLPSLTGIAAVIYENVAVEGPVDILAAQRARFLADPEGAFAEAGLSDEERAMVRSRDWRRLIRYGAIFSVLEKLGAAVGVSNLHIYAAMRGESFEAFQQTRDAPGALYSVAGRDAGALIWDAGEKTR